MHPDTSFIWLFYIEGKVECLEEAASLGLREILLSLMNDCDQRQTLIHDLITKNDQLKYENTCLLPLE